MKGFLIKELSLQRSGCSLVLIIFFLLAPETIVFAQENTITTDAGAVTTSLFPTIHIPSFGSEEILDASYSADIEIAYTPKNLTFLNPYIETGYEYLPTTTSVSISRPFIGLGIGFNIRPDKRLTIPLKASAGYAYSFVNNSSSGSYSDGGGYLKTSAGIKFLFGKIFSGRLAAGYENHFGFNQGIFFQIGGSLTFPVHRRQKVEIRQNGINSIIQLVNVEIDPVLPILRTYYDQEPIGMLNIVNITDQELTSFSTEVLIPRYMDSPKSANLDESLLPRGKLSLPLKALFSEDILSITEGTKIPAEITIRYDGETGKYEDKFVETVEILNRNAIIWDDDAKIATFITSKDPTIRSLGSTISSLATNLNGTAFDDSLAKALAVYQTLVELNVDYIQDPQTPYAEFSGDLMSVDYVLFPRQTLEYGGGDCDDLSILYCALLESMGVETAFVTIPGHIYTAVKILNDVIPVGFGEESVIRHEDEVWIPIEVTVLEGGFLNGWDLGGKQWMANPQNRAIIPTRVAWQTYAPVALPGTGVSANIEDKDELSVTVDAEFQSLRLMTVEYLVSRLPQTLENQDPVRYWNKVGVINARHGLYEKARVAFGKALVNGDSYITVFNLGKLALLMNETEEAVQRFKEALSYRPEDSAALVALYVAYKDNDDFIAAENIASRLELVNPQLAAATVGTPGEARASDLAKTEEIPWLTD